jgi:hypothetical protein
MIDDRKQMTDLKLDQPLAADETSLIEKETIEKRISNNEYRMSNVECRRKEFYRFLFIQGTERSDSILHDSAVRYSIFCGSLFSQATSCQSGQFNQKKIIFL